MRTVFLVAFLWVLLGSLLRAQDDPKACAAITDGAKRLECFDLIFKKSSVTTTKSAWEVIEEKSKIDDSTNVFLHLNSVEPVKNQYGRLKNLSLNILCREKKTDLYIIFADYFMSSTGDKGSVTFRVDKKPAIKKQLSETTDHKALGLFGAESVPSSRHCSVLRPYSCEPLRSVTAQFLESST